MMPLSRIASLLGTPSSGEIGVHLAIETSSSLTQQEPNLTP